MKDDETLSVYLTRLLELVNQMRGLGCWFKGKPKCHGFNRFGHFIKDCNQAKAGKLANFANQVTEPATMFYVCHSATIGRNVNMWYVDSACSNHMTSHESLLVDID
ncbi:hypothetical protein CerSpe_191810 [Prunus speciosa]